jgi:hypothetical protein
MLLDVMRRFGLGRLPPLRLPHNHVDPLTRQTTRSCATRIQNDTSTHLANNLGLAGDISHRCQDNYRDCWLCPFPWCEKRIWNCSRSPGSDWGLRPIFDHTHSHFRIESTEESRRLKRTVSKCNGHHEYYLGTSGNPARWWYIETGESVHVFRTVNTGAWSIGCIFLPKSH